MADPNGNGNGKLRIDPTVALQMIAWIIAAVFTYGAISSRVAVVESKQSDTDRRMERIEDKVDHILSILSRP